MKTTLLLCAALASLASAAQPVLVRPTAEAITRLQKQQAAEPMNAIEITPEGKPAVAPQKEEQSIIKQSMILHDGKNWTLVPKGAVVYLPAALKNRVDVKPVGRLLPFLEFITQNRSWITTNEVSFDQAAGNEALPAERAAFWSKQDKVVIATHQSGPISVIVKPTPAPATATATATAATDSGTATSTITQR
ncbi:MAG: hypothetical protein EOO70_07475 [Myxococcaceae bacterium]|nr:MAG: hypothetical protein EOO70_07475 [Myxococcaceae bacterium]